jgi:HK97 family phage prohead protease
MERYEAGAFAKAAKDPARVKVCLEHSQIIGRVTSLAETPEGLTFEARISDSPAIPEALKARAMITGGLADELSVGFQCLPGGTDEEVRTDGTMLWRHRRLRLREISLVGWGAMGRDATLTRARIVDWDEQAEEQARDVEARRLVARGWLADYRARGAL